MIVDIHSVPFDFWLIAAGVLGLLIGSFLNVIIHRLPATLMNQWKNECHALLGHGDAPVPSLPQTNLWFPRSCCPHCHRIIRAFDNIPLLSYLILRGRCRHCGGPISWRYPLVEALTAAAFVWMVAMFGITWHAAMGMGLSALMIPLVFIDIKEMLLPDEIVLPGLWVALLATLFLPDVTPSTEDAILGASAGYLSLWSVYWVFRLVTGKEGMGYGDFKLCALLGAWLGWMALPAVILLSAGVGAIVGILSILTGQLTRDTPMPFGPYLAMAGWLCYVYGTEWLMGVFVI